MADESNTEVVEATTPAETAAPKKRRGPKPKQATSEVAAEAIEAKPAKAVGGRRKTPEKSANEAVTGKAAAKTTTKKPAKSTEARPAKQASAPAPVLDEIADLLQLEEENAKLRKALAEKLRTENADLRKRLGLA